MRPIQHTISKLMIVDRRYVSISWPHLNSGKRTLMHLRHTNLVYACVSAIITALVSLVLFLRFMVSRFSEYVIFLRHLNAVKMLLLLLSSSLTWNRDPILGSCIPVKYCSKFFFLNNDEAVNTE